MTSDAAIAYGMAFPTLQPYFQRREGYSCAKGSSPSLNGYCYIMAARLDADPLVEDFHHEAEHFEFFNPSSRTAETHAFDFKVWNHDGQLRLLLVLPQFQLHTPVTEAMIEVAEGRAKELGGSLEIWTEIELFGPNPSFARGVLHYYLGKLWTQFPPSEEEVRFSQEEQS